MALADFGTLQDGPAQKVEEGLLLEPPRVYLLHFADDNVFRPGASFVDMVPLLDPCRVVVLGYDEEAMGCETLQETAALFKRRIWGDFWLDRVPCGPEAVAAGASGVERMILIGYAFGAIVAHQVALQLQEEGFREVMLVLLDSEVTWPPSYCIDRMGGYQWLGGEIEAALSICRAMGSMDFARELAVELVGSQGERDIDDVLMRVFWELAPGGITQRYFCECIAHSAAVLERLNYVAASFGAPDRPFDGPSLLLVSTSREFRGAEEINRRYCSRMEVACGRGNHYNFVQGEHALSITSPLSNFMVNQGFFGPVARAKAQETGLTRQPPPVSGLEILSEGDDPMAPTIYISHDVRPYMTKEWKEEVARLLAPCRVACLQFDSEAFESESQGELAALYQRRILLDARSRDVAAAERGALAIVPSEE